MLNKCYGKAAIIMLACLLVLVGCLSLTIGQIDVPFQSAAAVLMQQLGLPFLQDVSLSKEQLAVIWYIRLPRMLVGMLVGGALGISGAVMQGILSCQNGEAAVHSFDQAGKNGKRTVPGQDPADRKRADAPDGLRKEQRVSGRIKSVQTACVDQISGKGNRPERRCLPDAFLNKNSRASC